MSWSISINPVGDLPEVSERYASFCQCPGNMYYSIIEMKDKQLRDMDRDECISSLIDLIAELSKGEEGRFTNKWAVEADEHWSQGRETRAEWVRLPPQLRTNSYEEYTGQSTRERIREDAIRFLLYYKAGYDIEYTW